ncbi:hypothetical protein, partial [Klebsiella aerogenes]|uniref:hypothetical protein n=1 Tax=Klebsiella aerogenes TaxID=548 RepID=UPI001953954F
TLLSSIALAMGSGTEVMCFVDPVQTANEFHSQGHIIALAAGDVVARHAEHPVLQREPVLARVSD